MFEESKRADEVDEKLVFLSTTIHRLELMNDIPADIDNAQLDNLECAALNLTTSIIEYLTFAIRHFSRSFIGETESIVVTEIDMGDSKDREQNSSFIFRL